MSACHHSRVCEKKKKHAKNKDAYHSSDQSKSLRVHVLPGELGPSRRVPKSPTFGTKSRESNTLALKKIQKIIESNFGCLNYTIGN